MESKVEAVLAGKKSSFPADMEEKEAMAAATAASSAAIFAFLAPPLSLLRHVACLCASNLGLDGGGLKPSAPAPASSSSSSSAAAAACQRDEPEAAAASVTEDGTEVVFEVRSRGFTPPKPRSAPMESRMGAVGGVHH